MKALFGKYAFAFTALLMVSGASLAQADSAGENGAGENGTGEGCRAEATRYYDTTIAFLIMFGADPASINYTEVFNEAEKRFDACRDSKGKGEKDFHLGPQQVLWR